MRGFLFGCVFTATLVGSEWKPLCHMPGIVQLWNPFGSWNLCMENKGPGCCQPHALPCKCIIPVSPPWSKTPFRDRKCWVCMAAPWEGCALHAHLIPCKDEYLQCHSNEPALTECFICAVLPMKGKALTYCSSEIFTLANVREFQDFLPLFAFAFAFPSTPCRERNIRIRLLWGHSSTWSLPAQSQFLWIPSIIKAETLWVDIQADPWKCSRKGWMGLGAIRSSKRYPCPVRSLLSQTILWFYDTDQISTCLNLK